MTTPEPLCRWCATSTVRPALDLGSQPAADQFPLPEESGAEQRFPLRMGVCATCGLAQLLEDPTVPDEPRGVEPAAMVEQATRAIELVAASGRLATGSRLAEFDSPHGGSWRPALAHRGLRDVTDSAEQAEIVLDVFSMMHDADQRAALTSRVRRLSPDGVLLLQYHPITTIVAQSQWNALRHGHMAYYSTTALTAMLGELGLRPVTAWTFSLYGGTVLLLAGRDGVADETVQRLLELDRAAGATDAAFVAGLQPQVERSTSELRRWLAGCADRGDRVMGYSAASRAVPLLNSAEITSRELPSIADGAEPKWGRTIPGVGIPIVSPAQLLEERPDKIVLFVPDLLNEVRRAFPEVEAWGGRWVTTEPSISEAVPIG